MENKRIDFRLPFKARVIYSHESSAHTTYCSNISRGGLFLLSTDPFPIDSQVHLTFTLPHHPETLSVKGKVAHVSYDKQQGPFECGMGVQFKDIDQETQSILNIHLLNEKISYFELRTLLEQKNYNLVEIKKYQKKIAAIRESDLLLLTYQVNRVCEMIEPGQPIQRRKAS